MGRVSQRSLLRAAAVAVSVPITLLALAAHALASTSGSGDAGPGLTVLQTVGIFVGIPVGLFVLIWLLVYAPSMVKGPRYRPGLTWWAAARWFNGPPQGLSGVSGVAPGPDTTKGGGASARW